MRKKVLSVFLALIMVLCLAPTVALAEGNTGTTTIRLSVAGSEAAYELVIPAALTVKKSGYNAFENGVTIKNLTNADRIVSINVSATSANGWNLTDSNQNKISYKLVANDDPYTAKTTYSFTDKISMATAEGSSIACGVYVSDYSAAAAGEYVDTITWTANANETTFIDNTLGK